MSSKIEKLSRQPLSLPAVQCGNTSLVNSPQGHSAPQSQSPTPRSSRSENKISRSSQIWISTVKDKIESALLNDEIISPDNLSALNKELSTLFIAALQTDRNSAWLQLKMALDSLTPIRDILHHDKELLHYIERVVYHLQQHQGRLSHLNVTPSLLQVFPDQVQPLLLTKKHPSRSFCRTVTPLKPDVPAPARISTHPDDQKNFRTDPHGRSIFRKDLREDYDPKMEALTMKSISEAIGEVTADMTIRESAFGHPLLQIAQALDVDFSEYELPRRMEILEEMSPGEETDEVESISVTTTLPKSKPVPREPMTGKEAVIYFTKCYHLKKVKFMYFKPRPNRHFHPYDLIATPKNKISKEHYVFSTFGVLRVSAESSGDALSLTEWNREAVLYRAISQLTFFKTYLIRKMFSRWKNNIRHICFLKTSQWLSDNILTCTPIYAESLLQITKLLRELETLQLVPTDASKTWSLDKFKSDIHFRENYADELLEKFYSYLKLVLDETAAELFKRVQFCQEQLHQKNVFNNDPMYIQREKQEAREKALLVARTQLVQMGTFIRFVNLLLSSSLVKITLDNANSLVNGIIKPPERSPPEGDNVSSGKYLHFEERPALFQTTLVIDYEKEVLTVSPNGDDFRDTISSTISQMSVLLLRYSFPMDGVIKDEYLEKYNSIKRDLQNMHDSSHATYAYKALNKVENALLTESKLNDTQSEDVQHPYIHNPTKKEDSMRVATPDLINRQPIGQQELRVDGRGFIGHYKPIESMHVMEILNKDECYQSLVTVYDKLIEAGMADIDNYCYDVAWLLEIAQHCKSWQTVDMSKWRGVQAFVIDQKLTNIRSWTERLKGFDSHYITENQIFCVDCCPLIDSLTDQLNKSYHDIVGFVSSELFRIGKVFLMEMNEALLAIKCRNKQLDKFALFSSNYQKWRNKVPAFQNTVDFTKTLFELLKTLDPEVIRLSYRPLTADEEKMESRINSTWESLLVAIQEASEYYNQQIPIMTKMLENMFEPELEENKQTNLASSSGSSLGAEIGSRKKVSSVQIPPVVPVQNLEEEARKIYEYLTTGIFLDPLQSPNEIIGFYQKNRKRLVEIHHQLSKSSKQRELITGKSYDLTEINTIFVKVDLHRELWKYYQLIRSTIEEWKKLLFTKFTCATVSARLNNWEQEVLETGLKIDLDNVNPIQEAVLNLIRQFSPNIHILTKLFSPALKTRHWKSLFLSFGEEFTDINCLRISQLLSFDLIKHEDLIDSVYAGALAEYQLEQSLEEIKSLWESRDFQFGSHVQEKVLIDQEATKKTLNARAKTPVDVRHKTPTEKFRNFKEEEAKVELESRSIYQGIDREVIVMSDIDSLLHLLQHSRITLESILSSQCIEELAQETRKWTQTVTSLQDLIDLLLQVQNKWQYLERIFDKASLTEQYRESVSKFLPLHHQFLCLIWSMQDRPRIIDISKESLPPTYQQTMGRVTSLGIGGRATENENQQSVPSLKIIYRSGEYLYNELKDLLENFNQVGKELSSFILHARRMWPRLFFLSDEELMSLLTSACRNPQSMGKFASQCMPEIVEVVYQIPESLGVEQTGINFTVHSSKLEAICVIGNYGERLVLDCAVPPNPLGPDWLSRLEIRMKSSCVQLLQTCVKQRLDAVSTNQVTPLQILEELTQMEESGLHSARDQTHNLVHEIHRHYKHWLLRYPTQSVLTAERIVWQREVSQALENHNKQGLKQIKEHLESKVNQLIAVLKTNMAASKCGSTRKRLQLITQSLVLLTKEQIEIMDSLLQCKEPKPNSFDWLRVLRHEMDITTRKTSDFTELTDLETNRSATSMKEEEKEYEMVMSPVRVNQLGQSFTYDYEYYGPQEPLILTPLTDKALIAMNLALRMGNIGCLVSEPGTGRGATQRELAYLLARCLISVRCHQQLTVEQVRRYLYGSLLSGNLLQLVNIQELSVPMMSHFSQQIDYLRTAIRAVSAGKTTQYEARGLPHHDKSAQESTECFQRRTSIPSLHVMTPVDSSTATPPIRRSFYRDPKEDKSDSNFKEAAETGVRRHSVTEEINISEKEHSLNRTVPLSHEHLFHRLNPEHTYPPHQMEEAYRPSYLPAILFEGSLLQPRETFSCLATADITSPRYQLMPETLKCLFRSFTLIGVDWRPMIEAFLLLNGFKSITALTEKLILLIKQINLHLSRTFSISMQAMRCVIQSANHSLHNTSSASYNAERSKFVLNSRLSSSSSSVASSTLSSASSFLDEECSREEDVLVKGLIKHFVPLMTNIEREEEKSKSNPDCDESSVVRGILRTAFPLSTRAQVWAIEADPSLIDTITQQLMSENLAKVPAQLEKILELHITLKRSKAVILCGPPVTGKTVCWSILARSLQELFRASKTANSLSGNRNEEEDDIRSISRPNSSHVKGNINVVTSHAKPQPRIEVVNIATAACASKDLLGYYDDKSIWHDGLLSHLIQKSNHEEAAWQRLSDNALPTAKVSPPTAKWFLLDGGIQKEWLNQWTPNFVINNSGERMNLPKLSNFLIESSDLSSLSPDLLSQCSLVYCAQGIFSWRHMWSSWIEQAKHKFMLTGGGWNILLDIGLMCVPSGIEFVSQHGRSPLNPFHCHGRSDRMNEAAIFQYHSVNQFLSILDALLHKYLSRDEWEKKLKDATDSKLASSKCHPIFSLPPSWLRVEDNLPLFTALLRSMFAYAFIWGFGGWLTFSTNQRRDDILREKFNRMVMQNIEKLGIPIRGQSEESIFNYVIDMNSGELVQWTEKMVERSLPGPDKKLFVRTEESDRHIYLCELLLRSGKPLLLLGEPGVGKTSLVSATLFRKFFHQRVPLSWELCATNLQSILQSAGSAGKQLVFIDDLHLGKREPGSSGSACHELLRHVFNQKGVYCRERHTWQNLSDVHFLAACTTGLANQSGAESPDQSEVRAMPLRLMRYFVTVNMEAPSRDTCVGVFSRLIYDWMKDFPPKSIDHCQYFAKSLSEALYDLFDRLKVRLFDPGSHRNQNPLHRLTMHQTFSVIQGLFLMSPRSTLSLINYLPYKNLCAGIEDTVDVKKTQKGRKFIKKKAPLTKPVMVHHSNLKLTLDVEDGKSEESTQRKKEDLNPLTIPIIRLWCHEVTRIFLDPIEDDKEKAWFSVALLDILNNHLCSEKQPKPKEPEVKPDTSTDLKSVTFVRNAPQTKAEEASDSGLESERVDRQKTYSIMKPKITKSDELEDDNVDQSKTDQKTRNKKTVVLKEEKEEDSEADEDEEDEEEDEDEDDDEEDDDDTVDRRRNKYQGKLGQAVTKARAVDKSRTKLIQSVVDDFYGPLLESLDWMHSENEDLTELYFTKQLLSYHPKLSDGNFDKSYSEANWNMVVKSLYPALQSFNTVTEQKISLIFFKDAVKHILRLLRVLAISRGHSLIISSSPSIGKSTLARLAACIVNAKYFEPECLEYWNTNLLHSTARNYLREACLFAGSFARPALVYMRQEMGEAALQDAATLMREGMYPNMLNETDITSILMELAPNVAHHRRPEKVGQVMETFLQNVRHNLHIVVVINAHPENLRNHLYNIPTFITHPASIDVHKNWQPQAFLEVAHGWITTDQHQEFNYLGRALPCSNSSLVDNPSAMCETLSHLLVHAHFTSSEVVRRLQNSPDKCPANLFSPLTMREVLLIYQHIYHITEQREMAVRDNYHQGLRAANEADQEKQNLQEELNRLLPEYEKLLVEMEAQFNKVKSLKEDYVRALEKCKKQEELVARLKGPLDKMKAESQTEFNQVNPIYFAALDMVKNLEKDSIEEIRSYRAPPQPVVEVMSAVCMLLGLEQSWRSAVEFMVKEDVYQTLEYFDKDNIPDDRFNKLARCLEKEEFNPDYMMKISIAMSTLCGWLHAVHKYSCLGRKLNPQLGALQGAEQQLNKAQSKLGFLKVDAEKKKDVLEASIQIHTQLRNKSKQLDKKIKDLNYLITSADTLLSQFQPHREEWNEKYTRAVQHLTSLPVDAFFTAVAVVYLSPLPEKDRCLIDEWQKCLESGNFQHTSSRSVPTLSLQKDYSIMTFLSTEDERTQWNLEPHLDTNAILSGLFLRVLLPASSLHWVQLHDCNKQFTDRWLKETMSMTRPIASWPDVLSNPHWNMNSIQWSTVGKDSSPSHSSQRKTNRLKQRSEFRPFVSVSPSSLSNLSECVERTRTHLSRENTRVSSDNQEVNSEQADSEYNESFSPDEDSAQHDSERIEYLIIAVDDPELDRKLVDAILMGQVIVLTQMDRCRNPSRLLKALIHRQAGMDQSGTRFLQIASELRLPCHPEFRLILETAAPVLDKRPGSSPLKPRRCLSVNFGISDSSVRSMVQRILLDMEMPHFDAQERLALKDVTQYKEALTEHKTAILSRVTNRSCNLLHDKGLLTFLMQIDSKLESCQSSIRSIQMSISQMHSSVRALSHVLDTVSLFWSSFHQQGVSMTYSDYHTIVSKSLLACKDIVKENRFGQPVSNGLPSNGSMLAARAKELSDAVTGQILRFLQSILSERQLQVYLLNLSFAKLMQENLATNQEIEMLKSLPQILQNQKSQLDLEKSMPELQDVKLSYFKLEDVHSCGILENILPALKGLSQNLIDNETLWEEYFTFPVSFVRQPPGFSFKNKLSAIHKAIIWRLLCPDRYQEVSEALLLHIFGWNKPNLSNYSIKEIYDFSTPRKPVVFFLPNNKFSQSEDQSNIDSVFLPPLSALLQISKQLDISLVHSTNLGQPQDLDHLLNAKLQKHSSSMKSRSHGTSISQTEAAESRSLLEELASTGGWLVMQNAHLLGDHWENRLISKLERILVDNHFRVHKNFRFFITLETDNPLTYRLPLCLEHNALRIPCCLSRNMSDTMLRYTKLFTEQLLPKWSLTNQTRSLANKTVLAFTLLHSTLLHRRQMGELGICGVSAGTLPQWQHSDWILLASVVGGLLRRCESVDGFDWLIDIVYAGQCWLKRDAALVNDLLMRIWRVAHSANETTDVKEYSPLLEQLFSQTTAADAKKVIESLKDSLNAELMQLPESTVMHHRANISRELISNLSHDQSIINKKQSHLVTQDQLLQAKGTIEEIQTKISILTDRTVPSRPVAQCFTREAKCLQQELSLLLVNIDEFLSQKLSAVDESILLGNDRFPSYNEHQSNLDQYLITMWKRAEFLSSSLKNLRCTVPRIVPFGLLQNPARFLDAMLVEYSRTRCKNLLKLRLDYRILPISELNNGDPGSGCYLTTLRVQGALLDPLHHRLTVPPPPTSHRRATQSAQSTALPCVLVTIKEVSQQTPHQLKAYKDSTTSCLLVHHTSLNRGLTLVSEREVLTELRLACNPEQDWSRTRVYLTCEPM